MSNTNIQKNMAYDNASYVARLVVNLGPNAAGSAGVTSKFVAHANLLLFSLSAYTTIAGTSTATASAAQYYNNGTNSALVHVNSPAFNLIRITNTAGTGVAPSVSTSTIGPFYADTYFANGTATGQVNSFTQVGLNTSTGTAGLNGLAINAGDQVYVVNGTDATAVSLFTLDYQIVPLANVVA